MKTLKYQIEIDASAVVVWDVLWGENTYAQWTHHFSPDSRMHTDWKIGGKTYFTDATNKNGMVSTIDKMQINKCLMFKHLGELRDGVEDTDSETVKLWSGGKEAYVLEDNEGKTTLSVEVDSHESFQAMFDEGFTKGLQIIKELSEATKKYK